MQKTRSLRFLALAWCVCALSSMPAHAGPQSLIVGEVKDIAPANSDGVWLTHRGGAPVPIGPYQAVYDGDTLDVRSAGTTATLDMAPADGGQLSITKSNSPYRIKAHFSATNAWVSLHTFFQRFGWIFSRPHDSAGNARMLRSVEPAGQLAASSWLPVVMQNVRAGQDQVYVVAWSGNTADVSLTDDAGALVARVAKTDSGVAPGSALIPCKGLHFGTYTLTIDDGSAKLKIPVAAISGLADRKGGYVDQTIDAYTRYTVSPNGKLQALSDLQSVANEVYLAKATIDAVRQGRTQ